MRLTARVFAWLLLCSGVSAAEFTSFSSISPDGDLAAAVFSLAREADPSADLDTAQTHFEHLLSRARERTSRGTVFEKADALAQLLAEEGYAPAENNRRRGSMLLPAVLETRRGNCMGFSLLYACLAQRLKLPFKIALIPEHAFIVCDDGSRRHFVETLSRGARYESFNDFFAARSELPPSFPQGQGFREERPALDTVAEALRDRRPQTRETSAALKPAVLNSPREILALLLTQVAGELDAPNDSARRIDFCAQAAAWHPRLAVAHESWGHFLHQKHGLTAAREKLLVASALQQEQGWLQSALRTAAAAGSAERVRELLKKGAPVRARDGQGRPALHFASSAETVRLLLNAGAELHATAHDGATALHFAARFGADDAIGALLNAGLRPGQGDGYGRAPLHYAAQYDQERALERLLQAGEAVDNLTASGWSALHLAAQSGASRAVGTLLKAGASVSLLNGNGASALNLAAAQGKPDAARLLLEAGSAPGAADGEGITPLHWAARRGQAGLAKLLLERGADVHATDRDGRTPLIFCAFSESVETARVLLDHNANVNAASRLKRTALHHAAHFNSVPLMRLLLERGAQRTTPDIYGRSPLDYCNSATRDALK